MSTENSNFLNHLYGAMARLMGEIVTERSLVLFRRAPQIQQYSPTPGSTDYHLCLGRRNLFDGDKGSFTCPAKDEGFLVFRNPVRLCVSFSLVAPGLPVASWLKTYDKLLTYFFDHRAIDPLLPPSYERYSALWTKLQAQKAELKIADFPEFTSSSLFQPQSFAFDYTALYHSGNPLREEQRTKTRIIDFTNDTNDRSVL